MMPCPYLYQATCLQLCGAHQVRGWLGGRLQEPIIETCAEIPTRARIWEILACEVVQHPVFVPHVTVGIWRTGKINTPQQVCITVDNALLHNLQLC